MRPILQFWTKLLGSNRNSNPVVGLSYLGYTIILGAGLAHRKIAKPKQSVNETPTD